MVQPFKQPFNSEIKHVLEEEPRGDPDQGYRSSYGIPRLHLRPLSLLDREK